MTDNWDDSDDEWDADDDELDARLGLNKLTTNDDAPAFDDEEDLAVKEKALADKANLAELKKKGTALQKKKQAEQERLEEEELARKAMAMEAEIEANMTAEELRALKRKQVEDADHELTDDLFGGVDSGPKAQAMAAAETIELTNLKDHLKHARKVAQAIKVSIVAALIMMVAERDCSKNGALTQETSFSYLLSSSITGSRQDSFGNSFFERINRSIEGLAG